MRRTAVVLGMLLAATFATGMSGSAGAAPSCATSGPAGGTYTVTVCITSPAEGEVAIGTVDVTGTAGVTGTGATIRKVVFSLSPTDFPGAPYLITDYTSPYEFQLPTGRFLDGTRTLSVVAIMSDGFESAPGSVDVTFANGTIFPPVGGATFTPWTGTTPPAGRPFVVAAVGDGASGQTGSSAVANLIGTWSPDVFLYLGDVYEKGSPTEFFNWYGSASLPSGSDQYFGRFRSITDPTIGNHEYYADSQAAGYRDYWDNIPHYYSYNVGGWHLISLDTTAEYAQTGAGSDQVNWLESDLQANSGLCTLVYFHRPMYSAGKYAGGSQLLKFPAIWSLLSKYGADVLVAAHDHNYERWRPLDDQATRDDAFGIPEFVAGTGGHENYTITLADPRLLVGFDQRPAALGALRLELNSEGAGYQYIDTTGVLRDSGSIPCHNPPPDLFSDGFETGNLSRWSYSKGLSAQTSQVASGAYAAQGTTSTSPRNYATKTLSSPQTSLYYRARVKILSQSSTLNLLRESTSTGQAVATLFVSSAGNLMLRNDVKATNVWSGQKVSQGVWHDVQMQVMLNGASSQTHVWFDGQQIPTLSVAQDLGTASAIGQLMLGDSISGRHYDVAFDEVGAGTMFVLPPSDTTAPTPPTGLQATAFDATHVDLSWQAGTDNVGVTGYDVYRNGALLASTGPGTTFTDQSATAGTSYTYTVAARDAAGQSSPQSEPATVTTPGAPPPTDLLFSDDFETGNLSRWTSSRGLTVQSGDAASGSYSARGTTATSSLNYAVKNLDPAQSDIYFRERFKILSRTSTLNLMRFQNSTGGNILTLFLSSSGNLMLRNDTAATNVWSPTVVGPGSWHEVQVHVLVSGASSQVEVWYDGVRQDRLSQLLSLGTAPVGRLMLGDNVTGRAYDTLFDDAAADTTQIS